MIPDTEDTIVAPSTAPGEGAIAVIRLSGPRCLEVADRIFRGQDVPSRLAPRKVHLGEIRHPVRDDVADQVLLVAFHAPQSYTTQNMVEISCHGGQAVVRAVMDAALAAGARLAGPGEFTLRAFLGGRIDLAQAEAVAMLVQATGEAQRRAAVRQLAGGLSRSITTVSSRLTRLLAEVEASIDFPGDDPDLQRVEEAILRETEEVCAQLDQLLRGASTARLINQGARVTIVGKPNVGKSSLLNALCGQARAIVTQEPGTTRDTIEVALEMGGLAVTMVDTAGLGPPRRALGSADMEGQRRSKEEIDASDLCLVVLDGSTSLDERDSVVLDAATGKRRILVRNKCDLPTIWQESDLRSRQCPVVTTSCLTGVGVGELRELSTDALTKLVENGGSPLVVGERHRQALEEAAQHLGQARVRASQRWWLEVVAEELREARGALRCVTGEQAGEELLEEIFSRFCVGK